MKSLGIIGALGLEIELLRNNLVEIEEYSFSGVNYYAGKLHNTSVVLCACGIGKVNAAIYTQILIDKFKVDAIINTGIAGSMSDKVGFRDLVISETITYHDVRKTQMVNHFPFCSSFIADANLISYARQACENISKFHIGSIVTGDTFVASNTLKKGIKEAYNPLCVEMEGAAIAHTCTVNSIPFVIIRSISDNADDNATYHYKDFEKLAATDAATIVHRITKML